MTNLHDKTECVIHKRNLKPALNHWLILKKVRRVIKFIQKACLKPHIDMNFKLRQKAKNNFEKDFFKLMNNVIFGKAMEDVRKHVTYVNDMSYVCRLYELYAILGKYLEQYREIL